MLLKPLFTAFLPGSPGQPYIAPYTICPPQPPVQPPIGGGGSSGGGYSQCPAGTTGSVTCEYDPNDGTTYCVIFCS